MQFTMFVCWEVKESGLKYIISTGESETTMLTCNVIYRVESNAKLPYFEWIVFLSTLLEVLYSFPVLMFELSIIVCLESWPLESLQSFMYQWLCFVLPAIKIESHCPCTSIVSILNNFLYEQSAYNKEFFFFRNVLHICKDTKQQKLIYMCPEI